MVAFLLGSVIVVVFVLLHVVACRLSLAARTVGRLVAIYPIAVLTCGALAAAGVLPEPGSWTDAARAILMSGAVFLVYLSFYTAVEKESASSVILLAAAREGGASRESLYAVLNDEDMIIERLRGLAQSGFVREDKGEQGVGASGNERFRLTWRGRLFLLVLRTARRAFTAEGIGG